MVSVNQTMTVGGLDQTAIGTGDLTYGMNITSGALGGTTTVEITPNHNFGIQVGAK